MENNALARIRENIGKVIVGKEEVIELLLASMAAGGHVLLEDVPGTGKTMTTRALAKSMDLSFARIQFTPDLLPSDVTGLNFFDQGESKFVFRAGPVFTNVLLADEINRATPRTQSALLECMGEGQVTVDGETRKLEDPFMVIATQNPVETIGCFPLPEAQLDRFLMKVSMGTLSAEQEMDMLTRYIHDEPLTEISSVSNAAEISELRKKCREVYVHPELMDYILRIVRRTRGDISAQTQQSGKAVYDGGSAAGVSPRGTLALLRASQGYALVKGRDYVVPEDIKAVAAPVLVHRFISNTSEEKRKAQIVSGIISSEPVPTEDWNRP
ncbi:MAG: AAA family ATPase [Lachnospiraceae bacterium]|nr:AAA family ATPase [Lachnospiraceae bacterium]